MYKTASTVEKLIGGGTAAVVFGAVYYYTETNYPPLCVPDDKDIRFIWKPKNYQKPSEINKEHIVVPGKEAHAEH